MKTVSCLAAALSFFAAAVAARPWPDSTARIVVFADQLPSPLSEAQRRFAATRLAGTQKMLRSDIRALRAYNSNFLCLHYQLAIGAGPEAFVSGEEWTSDWDFVNAQSDWFLLNGSERAHQTEWNWDVMNVTYSGDAPNSGFPQYWVSNVLARISSAENDGVFADSFTLDGCTFGKCHPTHPWLEDVALCQANWVPALNSHGRAVRRAFDADARGFKFIPNVGALVTGWDATDYGVGHGGMIEGFCFWGPGSYFDTADWELQMGRALGLSRSNKIVICQAYPSTYGYSDRMFATASYLLIRGKYTYLNLLSTSDVALEYYPEYDIPLGAALAPQPDSLDALYDPAWGVYRRDFANGMALVNPSGAPRTISNLGAGYYLVSATGGGVVDEDGDFGGVLAYTQVAALNMPADSAAVLLIATNYTPPPPLPDPPASVTASDGVYVNKVRVSWDAAPGASAYEIWRNTINNPSSASLLAVSGSPRHDDLCVDAGVIYYYWVKATNAAGASGFSASDGGYRRAAPGSPAVNDYDGDGVSEIAVYDNNSGHWYAYSLQSGQPTIWREAWGWPGAETAPGDYDGDLAADLAVYDQANGNWFAWSAARGLCILWGRAWGWAGAETAPGDYDGDRVSDMAVYDQQSGSWYIFAAEGSVLAWRREWGWPGAVTVPGDYDGDKKSDLCVYDSRIGYWYAQSLAGAVLAWAQPWGWPGATTVPGDYDGDGNADLAVYDKPSGSWYVWSMAGNRLLVWQRPWGWPGAVPVPGDFDGDRAADLAVFDTSLGSWYIWSEALDEVLAWDLAWGWPGAFPPGGRY